MNNCVDTSRIEIKRVNSNVAKEFVGKHHYTHKMGLCVVAYGIFFKKQTFSKFIESEEQDLIGVIVFSQPAGRSAAASLSNLISPSEVFELTRLVCLDGEEYGKNLESYSIACCIKLIKKEFPSIKAIISYADGEQNHNGKIYQATNFLYQGNSSVALMPNYSISLSGPDEGYKWIHSRTVSSRWGSHNVEHLKKAIGKTFYRKKESSKHRYILFISDKVSNKKFIKNLKHPILPYPKNCEYKEEIEEIKVENKEQNTFFN